MANTIVQLHSLAALGTLSLKLYPRTGGGIQNGASGDALTEHGSTPGLYRATVTEALAGIYAARVFSGSNLLGSYVVDLRDDTGAYDLADPMIVMGAGSPALGEFAENVGGGSGGGNVTGFSSAALLQLAGITIRLSQPFTGPDEPLLLVQGDDYSAADGRAIEITVTGLDMALDLSSAAGSLSLKLDDDLATFAATDIGRAGDDVVLRFEPAASETAGLRASQLWKYDVQLTLASGHKITPLAEACAIVRSSYSP